MAKLKFKNPKTGLWEEAGGTTYTAGDGISISPSNVISAVNKADVTKAGDNTFTGNNTFSGTVTVPMPTADNQAATKKYVDDHASGGSGDVTAAGNNTFTGTNEFTGVVTFHKNVTIGDEAGNATLDMYSNKIIQLADPTANSDAANKKYVDDKASALNIKNGTGARSLLMNNDNTVTEPDDANTGIPVYSEGIPQANGIGSFAVGAGTKAEGHASMAEGINTKAGYVRNDKTRNVGSHAEGINTYAKSSSSHAEGFYTQSLASNSHSEGFKTTVNSDGWSGHAEGRQTVVNGKAGHAEGYLTQTNGTEAHAEGMSTKAEGDRAHAEGENTIAGVKVGDTFNEVTVTDGNRVNYRASHAEGIETKAYMKGSHAEGGDTTASGSYSHAEGDRTKATGSAGHAEGCLTTAGYRSHAEGEKTIAGGSDTTSKAAHAEGISTQATGGGSHAEGKETIATGLYAHAEGLGSHASGTASHAGGQSTIAQWDNSTVVGQFNKTTGLSNTNSSPLFIVGNGNATNKSNAFEVYKDGTGYLNNKKILVEGDASGGGGVTATGDNYFTGANTFSEIVGFDGGITVDTTGIECNGPISLKAIQATARYIDGLVTPTSDDHAANKKYVDDKVITSATANATTLSYYEPATASVKLNNGVLDFTFGIPQGEPAENPCLIEGTQITMADNTTKSVEDLKSGDVILSYDPVKKQKTNAVVIDAYKTGEAKVFDVYSFENGKYLTVYGIHGFYANELGYVKNIQDITKTNELIDENLNTTYLIVKRKMPLRDKPKSRYMIISSNNLYFANGILLGHSPWNKGQYCIKYGVEIPETLKTLYQSEIDAYNGYDSFINTPEYHAEISEQYAKLANAVNEIKIYKNKLTKTDYKAQKYLEGVLPETEWLRAKADRAAWRQAVNDNEQLRDESKKMVDNIIKKYRNGVTMKQLFEESCVKDNASFETVKNYFNSNQESL